MQSFDEAVCEVSFQYEAVNFPKILMADTHSLPAGVSYGVCFASWKVRSRSSLLSVVILSKNTLQPRQNGFNFANDIFKFIYVNENVCIVIQILL